MDLADAADLTGTAATRDPAHAFAALRRRDPVWWPGEAVFAAITAANRDPAVFDQPDRLDLSRTPVGHVTFGHGAHFCIGAALARLEMTVALPRLARRYPDLAPAWGNEGPRYRPAVVMKTLTQLPVTLGVPTRS